MEMGVLGACCGRQNRHMIGYVSVSKKALKGGVFQTYGI